MSLVASSMNIYMRKSQRMALVNRLMNVHILYKNGKPMHIAILKKRDPAIVGNYIFHTSSHQDVSWPIVDTRYANDEQIEKSIKASTQPLWLLE